MSGSYSDASVGTGGLPPESWRANLSAAARFWEPRRLVYNFLLIGVVTIWLLATWPHFRPALTLSSLLPLVALGLIANLCYCAAYLIDIPLQRSAFRSVWVHRRWGLWLLGTLFAVLLANYWIADEIYPSVR